MPALQYPTDLRNLNEIIGESLGRKIYLPSAVFFTRCLARSEILPSLFATISSILRPQIESTDTKYKAMRLVIVL